MKKIIHSLNILIYIIFNHQMVNAQTKEKSLDFQNIKVTSTPMIEKDISQKGEIQIIKDNDLNETETTIICAPMRVCLIKLLNGEKIIAEFIGDSSRWEVVSNNQKEQSFIAIKPKKSSLETNYIIVGQLKTYYFNLKSTENQYMHAVIFQNTEQNKNNINKIENINPSENVILTSQSNYEMSGEAEFKPLTIWTDNIKTYIKLPINLNELPVFIAKTAKGEIKAVNARWLDHQYIIDEKIIRGELIRGTGRYQEKIEINYKDSKATDININKEIN